MAGVLCSMVGASFTVAAAVTILRSKKGITAVGNAQISTAQSYFGGASALFDGTGDYLVSPAQFSLGTDDWTVECWIRVPSLAAKVVWETRTGDNDAGTTSVQADGTLAYYDPSTGDQKTTSTYTANTWFHACWERSGSTLRIYINGVVGKTATISSNLGTNRPLTIGASWSGGFSLNGHIDEFRVSNTARYTGNFTPATQPFTNDANTLLLIHANGTNASTFFEDDNGVRAQRGITAIGNAQVDTAQSKFGGASALFDGSGDYLTISNHPNFAYGTNDFTIEFWFRPNSFTSTQIIWDQRPLGTQTTQPTIYTQAGQLFYYTNAGNRITGSNLSTGTWQHIAVSRSGTSTRMFVNGTQVGSTYTDTTNYTSPSNVRIGADQFFDPPTFINGHLDEIRVSNSARYTANFTPATQPFTNDANTLLLIHADGTDAITVFRDDNGALGSNWTGRTQRSVTAVNQAKIGTAQSQFGGSSAVFDGADDYLLASPSSDFAFGTGNWTIEMWIRPNGTQASALFDTRPTGAGNENAICLYYSGSNLTYFSGGNIRITGANFVQNTWQHIALVRNGNDHRLYINGTQSGSTYTDTNSITSVNTSYATIATSSNSLGQIDYSGWIDEVRLSNTARYTTTFTPSTSPFVNDANTLLLIHANGADASTTFTDDIGTGRTQKGIQAIGNAQVDTAQSKFGGASALFDGTGDWLGCYNDINGAGWDAIFNPTNTPLTTIEFWVRLTSVTTRQQIIGYRPESDQQPGWALEIQTNGTLRMFRQNYTPASTASLSANTWHHIAIIIDTNIQKLYIDGNLQINDTDSAYVSNSSQKYFYIGWSGITALGPTTGHIDEFRISNTARYTANFTAPTAPFQNDANTLLLIHADGTDASTVFFDDNGIAPYTP